MINHKQKVYVILPAFNEARVIGQVLVNLKKVLAGFKNLKSKVLVVDDGSQDKTSEIAKSNGATVLRHVINRGLGGTLQTGLEYVRLKGANIAVTMDSDGQHDPRDLGLVIGPILEKKADVVIGSRFLRKDNRVPYLRKIMLKLSNVITFFLFKVYTTDSQSGFRAFSQKAIKKIRLRTQRMEVSSELFEQIKKNKLKYKEIPIKVFYTSYSRQKGQTNLNGVKILLKLILRLAR